MVSRQSNLYNYTPPPRSVSSRVSFINRVFVRHICDHARSIFSLFLISHLPPTCTFLYCSSTEQPSRATMLSPFQWKSKLQQPSSSEFGTKYGLAPRLSTVQILDLYSTFIDKMKPCLWDGLISPCTHTSYNINSNNCTKMSKSCILQELLNRTLCDKTSVSIRPQRKQNEYSIVINH